eukprot:6429405-Prymnesium_polylepis.1
MRQSARFQVAAAVGQRGMRHSARFQVAAVQARVECACDRAQGSKSRRREVPPAAAPTMRHRPRHRAAAPARPPRRVPTPRHPSPRPKTRHPQRDRRRTRAP